jgi:1-acyl-sn-glycerol-3-phosphate acyltransferase
MKLSGQEYVDMYATAAKRQLAEEARRKAEAEKAAKEAEREAELAEQAARAEKGGQGAEEAGRSGRLGRFSHAGPAARIAAVRRKWNERDRAA